MQTLLRCAVAGFLFVVGVLSVGDSLRAQPTLTAVAPQTLVAGAATEITITGTNLVDPLQVWTSFQATVEVVPVAADAKAPTSRTLKVTPAADTPLTLAGIFVGTPTGATDIKLIMVDELPNQRDGGANHSFETAQVVPAKCAIEGVTESAASDFYRIALKKGQRISVEVFASRIQSTVDPLLRLLDSSGKELATHDDDAGLGAESRLSWVVSQDGDVVIEIRDSQYRAAGAYIIRVGDFPLITTPYPMGARIGSTVAFNFVGPIILDASAKPLMLPPRFVNVADLMGKMAVASQIADGQSRAFSEVVVSPFPEFVESEPNDEMSQATSFVAPCAVNGRFDANDDKDCYRFVALKGQAIRFEAMSRSAGSPAMVFLRVYDAAGKTLKETAVNDQDEWSVDFAAPADGVYYLMAEDLLHRGGSDYSYRVAAKLAGDYELAIKHDAATKLQLLSPQNAAVAIPVQCIRQGFAGPVKLELVSVGGQQAPLPFRIVNDTIPAGAAEHRLLIETVAGAPNAMHAVRIVGHAVGTDPALRPTQTLPKDTPHFATTRTTLRTLRPQTPYPHSSIDGLLAIAVVDPAAPFFDLKPSAPTVAFDLEKAEVKFDLTVARTNAEYKEAVLVLVEQLPEGFTAEVKQEKDVYHITVKGPKESAATFPLQILGYGQFKGKGQLIKPAVTIEVKK